jgi:hypothetical protein
MSAASRRARRQREREAGLRKPLVLCASQAAVEHAARLLPGRCIENAITDAIAPGNVRKEDGDRVVVALREHGLEAVCVRTTSSSGRRAWQPINVRPATRRKT